MQKQMSNGYLCIGGPADGAYFNPGFEPKHGQALHWQYMRSLPLAAYKHIPPEEMTTEDIGEHVQYKAWYWHQGEPHGRSQQTRIYLIPLAWDGFEALDWLERRAYEGSR